MDTTGVGFPLRIDDLGQVAWQTGDENIRVKIMEVLMTALGERVHLPEFGCGLRDLIFDPNNEILAATTEFAINAALQRWLGDEILVESVEVAGSADSEITIEVIYSRRDQLERSKVKIAL
jgi:phage baseplate assembly protein W